MKTMKKATLLALSILGGSLASGFVITPSRSSVRTITYVEELKATATGGEPKRSFLAKAADKLTSLLPVNLRPKEDTKLIKRGEIERRKQQKDLEREMKDSLRPFPWPVRTFGNALANTVTRTLGKEAKKAEVLLSDAQILIRKDKDLVSVLGDSMYTGRLFSQTSSTKQINRSMNSQIVLNFEVVGARQSGTATLIADKYARGHIVALRVRVAGINYDIDV